MKNNKEIFLSVLDSLQKENVEYVLIGGFAIVLHGSSRFTEDIDIFIKNNENNINKLRKALNFVFNDNSIEEITLSEINKYAVIRYGANNDIFIDIIGRLGEAFSFEDISIEEITVDGINVKIASLESLYKLKEKTYRAVDQDDLLFITEKLKRKDD